MANITHLEKRFAELAAQANEVEATQKTNTHPHLGGTFLDAEKLLNWRVKVRSLIEKACGADSAHYRQFITCENEKRIVGTNVSMFKELKAVFFAAKEDYEGGYMNSLRNLVQAEVFATELDQARELLSGGYQTAAAVVAGIVLETTLRQLCVDKGIPPGKLNKMNADLLGAQAYNMLWHKKITALADIRNNAAHGVPGKFTGQDVTDMIGSVERFVSEQI